jgi:hypothetical protein
LFGLAGKFRKSRPDRLTRLAAAIEALGDRDQKLIDESGNVERLRAQGGVELHALCRHFVDGVNARLSQPSVLLSPPSFSEDSFHDSGSNLFQINLRGRLLQLEFKATDELYGRDDFKLPYILRGAVRSFNQEFLERNSMDEQMIFYCPSGAAAVWYFYDGRTYRTGRLSEDFLALELERLL